jgi:MT0933-like antitoxin protein
MSFLDKAKELLDQHDDKVDQALDKAGDLAKTKFAGHDQQIDAAIDQAQQRTGAGDTTQAPPPAAPPAGAPPQQ